MKGGAEIHALQDGICNANGADGIVCESARFIEKLKVVRIVGLNSKRLPTMSPIIAPIMVCFPLYYSSTSGY